MNKIVSKAVALWRKNIPAKETTRAGSEMGSITQSVNPGQVPMVSYFLLMQQDKTKLGSKLL